MGIVKKSKGRGRGDASRFYNALSSKAKWDQVLSTKKLGGKK